MSRNLHFVTWVLSVKGASHLSLIAQAALTAFRPLEIKLITRSVLFILFIFF
jgi:hypothetical protein